LAVSSRHQRAEQAPKNLEHDGVLRAVEAAARLDAEKRGEPEIVIARGRASGIAG
jgi:hypothetical protein